MSPLRRDERGPSLANPYLITEPSPPAAPYTPRLETRSRVAEPLGILSIVLAAVNGLGNGVTIIQGILFDPSASFDAMKKDASPEMAASMAEMARLATASTRLAVAQGLAMIVMDVALVVVGVLLLRQRGSARSLAIGWSLTALAVLVARAVAFEVMVMPFAGGALAMMPRVGGSAGTDFASTATTWMRLSTHGSLGFMTIFPVALLIAMLSVRDGLGRPGPRSRPRSHDP